MKEQRRELQQAVLRSSKLNKDSMVAHIADRHVACMRHGHARWRKGSLSTSGQVQAPHKRPVRQELNTCTRVLSLTSISPAEDTATP